MADSGLCTFGAAPYRSVDSEFILRYTSTSHWYDGPPDGSMVGAHGLLPNPESLAFYPRHGLHRKDLPLFPQLFPGGIDELDARKGLREKLRLQSARSAIEPLKPLPLRPQVTPGAPAIDRDGVHSAGAGSKPLCTTRITSHQEIKQEVLRRLQLRRQNSSPNLAVHSSPSSPVGLKSSYTTDNIAGNASESDSACERHRAPVGRLHIPTFEEFKQMRQKEGQQNQESTAGSVVSGKSEDNLQDPGAPAMNIPPSDQVGHQMGTSGGEREQKRDPEEEEGCKSTSERTGSGGSKGLLNVTSSEELPSSADPTSSTSITSTHSPIRTGPSPRSPLQPLASSTQVKASAAGGDDGYSRRRRSSLETAGSIPFPPSKEKWERPSSCCPALLLEGADLSSYGAKIYKMKDGFIGSALDLIKKRLV